MMEQPEVSAAAALPIVSLRVALSDEARASLESVRLAQEAARRRARQQTRQARVLFALSAAAVALLAVGLGPRVAHWKHARRQAPIASLPSAISPPPAAPAIPAAAPAAAAAVPGADTANRAAAEPSSLAGDDAGCDPASVRSAPWRVSPEACARAFNADPNNPDLALAIAQAEHARGRLTDAAQWAKRALALDPKAAEAYVLIARADAENGRQEDARAAYRHYLELAPRGWHHAEARRALRLARSKQLDSSVDR